MYKPELSGMLRSLMPAISNVKQIRQRVKQRAGIPVCVGIAQTKTLAKFANHYATKALTETDGVCNFSQRTCIAPGHAVRSRFFCSNSSF